MNEINILDKNTIDKIAAGEVVERPSSVVKELTENAIDAGASAISIEIRDGGISLIRVTDNGSGIDKSQIKKAFFRHSTSKISDASDLSFIHTLGFRGEALSSISAVSRMELCTKTKESLIGTIYKMEGGEEVSMEDAGLPDGTTMIVRDLFYNTPARLKFLKTPQTEAGYCSSIVEKIALSHPEISIKYTVNGNVKLHTKGSGNLKDTVYGVFGRDITSALVEVHSEDGFLRIDGFIGEPSVQRSSRSLENYFVNGRYVKDKVIAAGIEEAYKGYQMKGSFPFTDLYITIEPEYMDVNVHPSKMEIRFFDNEKVFNSISSQLKAVLTARERIPSVSFVKDSAEKESGKTEKIEVAEPFETSRAAAVPTASEENAYYPKKDLSDLILDKKAYEKKAQNAFQQDRGSSFTSGNHSYSTLREEHSYETPSYQDLHAEESFEAESEVVFEQTSFDVNRFVSAEARKKHRVVGEVFDTYWIVEYENEMYIIDQHAAHEKVLYEKFVKELREGSHYSQNLSPSLIVTLSPKEEEALTRYQTYLEKLGFMIEHFGGSEYALSAVPADLYTLNDRELFLSFIDETTEISSTFASEMLEDRLATAACKAAVKGNNRLSFTEANALIDQLLSLDNPYNCPHGRPTIIKMSKYELEKKFKRII